MAPSCMLAVAISSPCAKPVGFNTRTLTSPAVRNSGERMPSCWHAWLQGLVIPPPGASACWAWRAP